MRPGTDKTSGVNNECFISESCFDGLLQWGGGLTWLDRAKGLKALTLKKGFSYLLPHKQFAIDLALHHPLS